MEEKKYVDFDRVITTYKTFGHLNLHNVLEAFNEIPAANVRPVVRGKWVYDHWCEFKCSNCGAWSKSEPYRGRENFCPNCGADMREIINE